MTVLLSPDIDWASDPVEPPDGAAWDLLVVGGGTAGLVAAKTAAQFGASVLLTERDRTGGDCLWRGCVPSKALLAAAHAASRARRAARYGVHVEAVQVDFAQVMDHVRDTIGAIEPVDSPKCLRAAGVSVVHDTARFTGPSTAFVGGRETQFRHALVATGSAPVELAIDLGDRDPLTSDSVWTLTELPQRLLVVGGGSIGCELGQAFARLGSKVTLVEAAERLLIREDPAAASLVHAALTADGVTVHTGTPLDGLAPRPDGAGYDQVLVAVGRRARTRGVGLEAAGVRLDERGYVAVDAHLRTSNPRIFAAGDVTGHPQFTHVAGVHASIAATNAVLGLRRRTDSTTIPRVTFTQPEVAAFGVGVERADRDPDLTVRTIEHEEVDRAIADGDDIGHTRLVLDRKRRVVGASIVGPRAGESIAELVLASRHGLRARDVAASVHAYPTYGDGVWKGAIAELQEELTGRPARVLTGALAALRRRRS